MATLTYGITDRTGFTTAGLNGNRWMGQQFTEGAGFELRGIGFYTGPGASSDLYRLAAFEGGSITVGPHSGPSCDLLWDSGEQTAPGSNQWVTHLLPGPTYPTITNNYPLWACMKSSWSPDLDFSSNSLDAGDWQTDRGRFASDDDNNSELAWADPYPTGETGSFANFWYAIHLLYALPGNPTIMRRRR